MKADNSWRLSRKAFSVVIGWFRGSAVLRFCGKDSFAMQRTALVTGADRGLGYALCKGLLSRAGASSPASICLIGPS